MERYVPDKHPPASPSEKEQGHFLFMNLPPPWAPGGLGSIPSNTQCFFAHQGMVPPLAKRAFPCVLLAEAHLSLWIGARGHTPDGGQPLHIT